MSNLVRLYVRLLEKHPWKVQCTTTGLLMGGGDLISQFAIEKRNADTFDKPRSIRFFLYGGLVTGPALRTWYLFLDRVIKGTPAIATVKRVALDQMTFAPFFCGTFIFNMAYLRTYDVDGSVKATKEAFIPVMLANYKLWPAAQLFNFYMVPFQHRILFVNVVALFWNTYLAWKTEATAASPSTTKQLESQKPV